MNTRYCYLFSRAKSILNNRFGSCGIRTHAGYSLASNYRIARASVTLPLGHTGGKKISALQCIRVSCRIQKSYFEEGYPHLRSMANWKGRNVGMKYEIHRLLTVRMCIFSSNQRNIYISLNVSDLL